MFKQACSVLAAALMLLVPSNLQTVGGKIQSPQRGSAVVIASRRGAPVPPRRQPVSPFEAVTSFNIRNFGAACDGSTDDTAAIQDAYNAAAAAMLKQGGAGIVYFPPSSGYCVVRTLRVPNMGYPAGWLTSIFDNGLFVTNTIYPGTNTAFIGRTSNFAAMGNVFLWGPTAEWQKPKWNGVTSAPVVDLDGVSDVYFEGIAFADASGLPASTIHVHDNNGVGSVDVSFRRCSVMGGLVVDSSGPRQSAGFGLHFEDTSMGNVNIENFGTVTIRGGYLHKVRIANDGIPSDGNLEISDVLTEALDNEDFLTVDTSGGPVTDITLDRVALADCVGTVYMLDHINNTGINWNVNVKFSMIPAGNTGMGLIDPASAAALYSVICEGSGCQYILRQAKATIENFIGMPPKSPMIVYSLGGPAVVSQ